MGSALECFSILGDLRSDQRVSFTMFSTTRWVDGRTGRSTNALDDGNDLLPTGRAVAMWGEFGRGVTVASDSSASGRPLLLDP